MTAKDALRLQLLEEAVLTMGDILVKIGEQVRPLGFTAAFERDLRDLSRLQADIKEAKE